MATQEEVLFALNETSDNLFITGDAGTGKSWVVNTWLESLPQGFPIAITAPTGVAALNINGSTLHRQFSIPFSIKDPISQAIFNVRFFNAERRKFIMELEVLLIDEISMVRSDVLTYIDYLLRNLRGEDSSFGGVRVITVGDPFQLPPVVPTADKKLLTDPWFFQSPSWAEANFISFNLLENRRVKDDFEFVQLLSKMRYGKCDINHLMTLKAKVTNQPHEKAVILSPFNRTVDAINEAKLNELTTETVTFTAKVEVKVEDKSLRPMSMVPAVEELTLRVGARVMLVNNDQNGQWVNGSVGEVREINVSDKNNPYVMVMLDCDSSDDDSGPDEIDLSVKVPLVTWRIEDSISQGDGWGKKLLATVTQLPIRLGWAVTVHKAQGMTLPHVHFDFSYIFEAGQAYVAISRCTSLSGLTMSRMLQNKSIIASPEVVKFMQSAV